MNEQTLRFRPVSQDEVDWLGTYPIPAKAYYDAEYFELERKAVFLRGWLQIGHVCEVPEPGSFMGVEVQREAEPAHAKFREHMRLTKVPAD